MDVTRAYVFLLIRLSFRMNSIWKGSILHWLFQKFSKENIEAHTHIHTYRIHIFLMCLLVLKSHFPTA